MKKKILVFVFIIGFSCANKKETTQIAELSCGQCKFDLDSESGCSLAVRIDDKAYFVEGFNIDDFGDAHDEKIGFCNVVRKGTVTGEIKNNRYIANAIQLVE